ncbi:hypothetical protein [Streptomyces sp. 8L]|uniref:hypothetical protein n=1 Tax=Streptomyces sp. 8L TaxID=2877242 RepID=UPI001CD36790|nr:hypothetical protein [Streptomyces sp. 8L]MCA1219883.1 hypothetical protein [Streptomyces sp. 8L]
MTYVPEDLLDRICALERQVRQLTGRAAIRPALTQVLAGDVVIGEGGQLIAQTPTGTRTFVVGQTPEGDWGVGLARENGAPALTVGYDVETGGQMVRTHSRSGTVIAMDDGFADGYLGRPWVPIPCSPFMSITNDDDTPLHSGYLLTQHKVLLVNLQLTGPAGTAAQVYMRLGQNQVGPTWTLSSSATTAEVNERVPLPANDFPWGTGTSVVMWARRTSGTGTCALRVRGLWGVNTVTEDEAN